MNLKLPIWLQLIALQPIKTTENVCEQLKKHLMNG